MYKEFYERLKAKQQDLTFYYAEAFFKKAGLEMNEEWFRKLGLYDREGSYTNMALLISDQCPHRIKCAIFEGEGKSRISMRKEFDGSLLKQMDEAYEYLLMHNHCRTAFDGMLCLENTDYPVPAIREALLNALIHRDYRYPGSTILNIFTNRIEFTTLGGLVEGLSKQDILAGISQSPNLLLARLFQKLKLIENMGTGLSRIREYYSQDIRQPEFIVTPSAFVAILYNRNIEDRMEIFRTCDTTEEQVLSLFQYKKEITRRDVERLLECPSAPARRVLQGLVCEERIEMIGRSKGARYVLK